MKQLDKKIIRFMEYIKNNEKLTYELNDYLFRQEDLVSTALNKIINDLNLNNKKDLAHIFNCNEQQIALWPNEIDKNTIYYNGSLTLSDKKSSDELILPQYIGGDLKLNGLTNIKGLRLPKAIGGTLSLVNLKTAEDLIFPESVGNSVLLNNLKSAINVIFPKMVKGMIQMNQIDEITNVALPEYIDGYIYMNGIKKVSNVVLPKYIDGIIGNYLMVTSLPSADGLIFPDKFNYTVHLKNGIIVDQNTNTDAMKKIK